MVASSLVARDSAYLSTLPQMDMETIKTLRAQIVLREEAVLKLKEHVRILEAKNKELEAKNKELDERASINFQEKVKYRLAYHSNVESNLKRKREVEPEKTYCDWCGCEEIDDKCQCGVTICTCTALPMKACKCPDCNGGAEGSETEAEDEEA